MSGAYGQVGEIEYLGGHKESARKYLEQSVATYRKWQHKHDTAVGGNVLQVPNAPTCSAMIRLGEIYLDAGKKEEGKKLVAEGQGWLKQKGLIK